MSRELRDRRIADIQAELRRLRQLVKDEDRDYFEAQLLARLASLQKKSDQT